MKKPKRLLVYIHQQNGNEYKFPSFSRYGVRGWTVTPGWWTPDETKPRKVAREVPAIIGRSRPACKRIGATETDKRKKVKK